MRNGGDEKLPANTETLTDPANGGVMNEHAAGVTDQAPEWFTAADQQTALRLEALNLAARIAPPGVTESDLIAGAQELLNFITSG